MKCILLISDRKRYVNLNLYEHFERYLQTVSVCVYDNETVTVCFRVEPHQPTVALQKDTTQQLFSKYFNHTNKRH